MARTVYAVVASTLLLVTPLAVAQEPTIRPDVVYGHKDGLALTFDVFMPAKPNGAAILFMMSGGWYSNYVEPKAMLPMARGIVDKGYTFFIVRHGSAPKYTVPEAFADVKRAVRFIRLNASQFNIDPNRLGVTGGSAGGHLTLMLATTGDDGDPDAKDELGRTSSRIAAAVALYPPTDLRGWVKEPPEAIRKIPALKPPLTFDPKLEESVSPVMHASSDDAPTLLIHGDKDPLVPLEHSHNMVKAMEKAMMKGELLVIKDGTHSFTPQQNQQQVVPVMMKWFDQHLTKSN